jgi:hypothetical protein
MFKNKIVTDTGLNTGANADWSFSTGTEANF